MLMINQVKYHYQQTQFCFQLQVATGDIIALIGPSGAGKSTLLALLGGFILPTAGDILVDGQSIVNARPDQRPFAMLFQNHNLFSHLSVRDNIGLGLHPGLNLNKLQQQQVLVAAQQVGLEEYLDKLPAQLSGGQQQRVALARCFVQPHSIWLLDEPFSALDPVLRSEMLDLVQRLAAMRKVSVLMVTHHLHDAYAIANRYAFIEQGVIANTDVIQSLTIENSHQGLSNFVAATQ